MIRGRFLPHTGYDDHIWRVPSKVDVLKETMLQFGMVPAERCDIWRLRVNRRDIAFLKFILEGYDGLAQLTTVNAAKGRVAVMVAPGCEKTVRALLDDLKKELMMTMDG